jgi:hypothetical protein
LIAREPVPQFKRYGHFHFCAAHFNALSIASTKRVEMELNRTNERVKWWRGSRAKFRG